MRKSCLSLCLTLFFGACTPLKFSPGPFPPDTLPHLENINVALVLGGGGAKGMAHVGVMEELLAVGIQPNLIVGCSAGAVVGALYADNPDIQRIKKLLMGQRRETFLNLSLFHLPFGFCNGDNLGAFLTQHIKSTYFQQLKIPFVAVATDLQYGINRRFGAGLLRPAIHASAAIPGVYHPVKINDHYYVDGGVTDNLPAEVASRMGAKFIIGVQLETPLEDEPPTNALGVIKRSLHISLQYQNYRSAHHANYVIKVPLGGVGIFDDDAHDFSYQKGREAARAAIPKILALMETKGLFKNMKVKSE